MPTVSRNRCSHYLLKVVVILSQPPRSVKDGDIVLCDMGCELYCYASDITNSFPAKSLAQKLPSSRSKTWKSLEMHGGFVVGDTVTKFRLEKEYKIRRWIGTPS